MKNVRRKTGIRLLAIAGVAAAAVGTAGWAAGSAQAAGEAAAPALRGAAETASFPADVQKALKDLKDVTPGAAFVPASAYLAKGTQTYTCPSTGTWPTGGSVPEANLVRLPRGGDTVHHYGGPRWEAKDGSILRGVLPPRVQVAKTGTIPWLLLDVTHEGSAGVLDPVTNISRILTRGGVAPVGTCVPGATASPTYQAVYVFWVPRPKS